MLIDSDNLVSKDGFCLEPDKYIAAARQGGGPVAITDNSQVVGFFVDREEYEAMFGVAIRKLLEQRSGNATVPHEEVMAGVRRSIQRRSVQVTGNKITGKSAL